MIYSSGILASHHLASPEVTLIFLEDKSGHSFRSNSFDKFYCLLSNMFGLYPHLSPLNYYWSQKVNTPFFLVTKLKTVELAFAPLFLSHPPYSGSPGSCTFEITHRLQFKHLSPPDASSPGPALRVWRRQPGFVPLRCTVRTAAKLP